MCPWDFHLLRCDGLTDGKPKPQPGKQLSSSTSQGPYSRAFQIAFTAELSDTLLKVARAKAGETRGHPLEFDLYQNETHVAAASQVQIHPVQLRNLLRVRPQLGDVELSADRYAQQDRQLSRLGLPTPAVLLGRDWIPVDLGVDNWRDVPENVARGLLDSFAASPTSFHRDLVDQGHAENGFKEGLRRFLKSRVFPADTRASPPHASGGFMFEVSTNSAGLRVHYSPAFFINSRTVFGLPSTPVQARLQPGRYVFGAYPPDCGYWSNEEYDVPGTTSKAHLDV
jgi:hypothetical protein